METPDPAEIREEEEEARAEDIARGDAQVRVPARDGQGGDMERGVTLTKGLAATRRRRTKARKKTCSASRPRPQGQWGEWSRYGRRPEGESCSMSSSSSWLDNRRQVKNRLNLERRSTRPWGLR
ncbi:hypothetical protein PC123_g24398 [Phytophthora cactorum]|nr:hypothetical protein PC123_g24398 [Phytophthora cactorum]